MPNSALALRQTGLEESDNTKKDFVTALLSSNSPDAVARNLVDRVTQAVGLTPSTPLTAGAEEKETPYEEMVADHQSVTFPNPMPFDSAQFIELDKPVFISQRLLVFWPNGIRVYDPANDWVFHLEGDRILSYLEPAQISFKKLPHHGSRFDVGSSQIVRKESEVSLGFLGEPTPTGAFSSEREEPYLRGALLVKARGVEGVVIRPAPKLGRKLYLQVFPTTTPQLIPFLWSEFQWELQRQQRSKFRSGYRLQMILTRLSRLDYRGHDGLRKTVLREFLKLSPQSPEVDESIRSGLIHGLRHLATDLETISWVLGVLEGAPELPETESVETPLDIGEILSELQIRQQKLGSGETSPEKLAEELWQEVLNRLNPPPLPPVSDPDMLLLLEALRLFDADRVSQKTPSVQLQLQPLQEIRDDVRRGLLQGVERRLVETGQKELKKFLGWGVDIDEPLLIYSSETSGIRVGRGRVWENEASGSFLADFAAVIDQVHWSPEALNALLGKQVSPENLSREIYLLKIPDSLRYLPVGFVVYGQGRLVIHLPGSFLSDFAEGWPTLAHLIASVYKLSTAAGAEEVLERGGVDQLAAIFENPPNTARLEELRGAVGSLADLSARDPLLQSLDRIGAAADPAARWLAVDEWIRSLNERVLIPNKKVAFIAPEYPLEGGFKLSVYASSFLDGRDVEWWELGGFRFPVVYVDRLPLWLSGTTGYTLPGGILVGGQPHRALVEETEKLLSKGRSGRARGRAKEIDPPDWLPMRLWPAKFSRTQMAQFFLGETRREELRHLQMMRRVVPRIVQLAVTGQKLSKQEVAALLGVRPGSFTGDILQRYPNESLSAREVQVIFLKWTEKAAVLERLQAPANENAMAMYDLLDSASRFSAQQFAGRPAGPDASEIRSGSLWEVVQQMFFVLRNAGRPIPPQQVAQALAKLAGAQIVQLARQIWDSEFDPAVVPLGNPGRQIYPATSQLAQANWNRLSQRIVSAGAEEEVLAKAIANPEVSAGLEQQGWVEVPGGFVAEADLSAAEALVLQKGLKQPEGLPKSVPVISADETTVAGMLRYLTGLALRGKYNVVFSTEYFDLKDAQAAVPLSQPMPGSVLLSPGTKIRANELGAAFMISKRTGTIYVIGIVAFTSPNWKKPLLYLRVQA